MFSTSQPAAPHCNSSTAGHGTGEIDLPDLATWPFTHAPELSLNPPTAHHAPSHPIPSQPYPILSPSYAQTENPCYLTPPHPRHRHPYSHPTCSPSLFPIPVPHPTTSHSIRFNVSEWNAILGFDCSLLSTAYCLLPTHYSVLHSHCSLFTTLYSLLTTYYSLLTTHYSLLSAHYSLLTTHYSPLTTHYSLLQIQGPQWRATRRLPPHV